MQNRRQSGMSVRGTRLRLVRAGGSALDRARRVAERCAPVPMVLRHPMAAWITNRSELHNHFQLRQAANFHLHFAAGSEVVRTERVLPGSTGERILLREQLVQRIIRQGARSEDGATGHPSARQTSPRTPVLARNTVPIVLLKNGPATATPAEPAAAPTASRPWPAQAVAQTPIDMGRLSDQVIQAIDRRLQAHRERTGRR